MLHLYKIIEKTNLNKKYSIHIIKNIDLLELDIKKPDCQRSLDNNHVHTLFQFQIKNFQKYNEFFFINPIIIGILDNIIYILDGMHRYKCIELLSKINVYPNFNIPIAVLQIDDINELDEKYKAINQNKPVPLPDDINDWKYFTKYIEEHLVQNYSKYFSNSERPISPNFNKEIVIKYINDNKIGIKVNYNYEQFIKEIEELNRYYQMTYSDSIIKYFDKNIMKNINTSIKKQSNFLLLSLYKNIEWVDRIVYKIVDNLEYNNMDHSPKNFRVKITKKLRSEVWNKSFYPLSIGKCNVCKTDIDKDNFECGHIKALFYGGLTNLSNLLAICRNCNNDMGIKNLEEYKIQLERELM